MTSSKIQKLRVLCAFQKSNLGVQVRKFVIEVLSKHTSFGAKIPIGNYMFLQLHVRVTCPRNYSASIYLLKVNNRNTRTRCEICSKLNIKTPERRKFQCNFENVGRVYADWDNLNQIYSSCIHNLILNSFCGWGVSKFRKISQKMTKKSYFSNLKISVWRSMFPRKFQKT